jgi:hypothetical protein
MGGIFGGGGGGGGSQPAPVTQQVNNTSIPAYAQPYVENMLGQAQALTDINQNPYQTYGGERIAAFTPMQAQAFQNTANMTPSGQLGTATDLATVAGLGSVGTANQLGRSGMNYQRNATSMYGPGSIGDYMNPYLAQSLAPQLNLLAQQYGIKGAQEQGAATSAGAFGGSRNALMQGLNQQNQLLSQQNAIAQGYNTAYQNAQQAQQFGANLGLQGLQGQLAGYGQAGQAAGTLGQLGQTQYGQQMGINAAQQQAGAVQQAQAQQGLDLSYSDFMKQKNYPYQQLGFMSDMVRGLPLSQTSQTMYSAPPNLGSQLGGLGMTALGIYGMSGGFQGKKKGGAIKMKRGGKIGYATGGDISMLTTQQLIQLLDNPKLSPMEADAIQEQLMLRERMENNPETPKIMGQGVDSIPTGDMVPEDGMAGGGIIAFARGGDSGSASTKETRSSYQQFLEENVRKQIEGQMGGNPFAKSQALQEEYAKDMAERKSRSPYEALAMAGLGAMSGTSPHMMTNFGLGGLEGLKAMQRSNAENAADRKLFLAQQVEAEKAENARRAGLTGQMQTSLGHLYARDTAADSALATRALANATKGSTDYAKAQAVYKDLFNNTFDELTKNAAPGKIYYKKYKDNPDQLKTDAAQIAQDQLRTVNPTLADQLNFVPVKLPAPPAGTANPATPAAKPSANKSALPASAPVALPMPKSAKDAVVGQVYNTGRGPAQWDGKQFIPIQ